MSEGPAVVGRNGAEERSRGEALRARPAAVAIAGLHLAVLSSFALAQPLFDLLGKTPEFFAVRGSSPREIVVVALALAIGVPATLILVELLAAVLAGWVVARTVHLLLVAGLFALFALQLLKRVEPSAGRLLVVLAAAGGALFAAAYARSRPVRAVVTVLGPAPLLFLGLFLFGSVAKLVFPDDVSAEVSLAAVKSETPVVVIVFDEFSSTSLLDHNWRIDAARFPNFAALARTSTWYPDATTVSQGTVRALPAILTGKDPARKSLPTLDDHPENLFTLLGRSHAVHAFEPVTRLCPRETCRGSDAPSLRDELESLGSDLGLVYLHLLLPRELARDLPPINRAWGNFRDTPRPRAFKERQFNEPAWAYDRFLAGFHLGSSRPPLHFAHINLPHIPYQYLPSGRRYSGGLFGLDAADRWSDQRRPVLEAHQRYLLQVGYVDRLLGRAFAQLRQTGLFDRALLVVTADHGVSFRAGEPRRVVSDNNFSDIAFVPLFVKKPGQRTGRTIRGVVRLVDILPTIADEAGVAVPWDLDGRSLGGAPGRATIRIDGRTFDSRDAFAARRAALARQRRLFGEGILANVFAAGPRSELVGRPLAPIRISRDRELRATLTDEDVFDTIDRRGTRLPNHVVGTLSRRSGAPGDPGLTIAVALNGRIAAVCESYRHKGKTQFSALVPESAFVSGPNRVDVLAVAGRRHALRITSLGATGSRGTYRLVEVGALASIRTPSGETIRVEPGAVSGYLDIARVEGEVVNLFGWAADVSRQRIRDRVLVFANGRFVHAVDRPLEGGRPDLGASLEDAGFSIYLDRRDVLRGPNPEVRVFGVIGGAASELNYPSGYRWGPS